MQVIIGPAMTAADRRSPERPAPDTANDAARHCANRTCDQEAGSGTSAGANPICTSRRRSRNRSGCEYSRCQQKLFHMFIPRLYSPAAPRDSSTASWPVKRRIS